MKNVQESLTQTLMFMLNDPSKYLRRMPWLLEYKLDFAFRNFQGRTALLTLLMSSKTDAFENTLNLLLANGLKLNDPVNQGYTQFTYCLSQFVDSDAKHANLQLILNSDLLENVFYMLKLGADPSTLTSELFFSLPEFYLTVFEKTISGKTDEAFKVNRSTVLEKFLFQFPEGLFEMLHPKCD